LNGGTVCVYLVMSTFQDRIHLAIGPRGYDNCMRRSLQSVICYEAKRCVEPRFPSLRPFQRKAAHLDQMYALVESLPFVQPQQKVELMWRTGSSKEPLDPEISWKRAKGIEKELSILAKAIKPLIQPGKSHGETVDTLVQCLYEKLTGFTGKPHPVHWEHAHNHVVMAFRMYYRFDALDPTFPAPVSPRALIIPAEKAEPLPKSMKPAAVVKAVLPAAEDDSPSDAGVALLLDDAPPKALTLEERRRVMQEVREHLELLKEFEGVISEEELAQRKRELFLALPSAPVSSTPEVKRLKMEEPAMTM
jgi:hypothetical protein